MKTKTFTLQLFAPCIVILALTCSLQLSGQSLVEFDASALAGSPTPTELPVANIVPNLQSTSITRNLVSPIGTNGAFTSSNWPVSPAAAPAGDKYLTFTLTAEEGYVLDLTGATVSFACRRSGSGPNAVYIYSSVGGFSSASNSLVAVSPIVSSGGTPVSYTFPNGGVYDNLFSIEIRIYADQANSTGGLLRVMDPTTGGNIRITGGQVKPYAMSSLPCGVSYNKKTSIVTAAIAPGAISYRFRFYNSTTGALISQFTQASRQFPLTTPTGLYYGDTYKWTVAVNIGYGFGPESNPNCMVTLAPAETAFTCGLVFPTLNSYRTVPNPVGVLNYRFTIYDDVTGVIIAQRTQSSNYLYFNTLSGLYYATTYKWTVACEYPLSTGGSAWGPESNPNCTVTFGPPMATLLCGMTYTNLNSYTGVQSPGGILNYKFTVYDNSTGAIVAQRTQASNYLYFNTLSGLAYGTTYKWTVACEYPLSAGGSAWGPESNPNCIVTFAAPVTTIPCGNTYVLSTGYSAAQPVGGALGYRFRFYQESVLVAERDQASNYIHFNQVSGLTDNQSYTWTVEVKYSTPGGPAYGPASNSSCSITFGSSARLSNEEETVDNAEATDRNEPTAIDNTTELELVKVYPNPATDKINVVSEEPVLACYIYSLTGELLKSYDPSNEIVISDLAPGMYFILVQTESGMKRANFVKE